MTSFPLRLGSAILDSVCLQLFPVLKLTDSGRVIVKHVWYGPDCAACYDGKFLASRQASYDQMFRTAYAEFPYMIFIVIHTLEGDSLVHADSLVISNGD